MEKVSYRDLKVEGGQFGKPQTERLVKCAIVRSVVCKFATPPGNWTGAQSRITKEFYHIQHAVVKGTERNGFGDHGDHALVAHARAIADQVYPKYIEQHPLTDEEKGSAGFWEGTQ